MSFPVEVSRYKVLDVLRDLGLDPNDVKRLTLEPKEITVEVYSRNPDGLLKVDGQRPVTTLRKIKVVV